MGDVGKVTSGGTPKREVLDYWSINEIPWITPSWLGKNQNNVHLKSSDQFISNLGLIKSSAQLISKGSIVYSSRAPIGHINIVDFDFSTNQGAKSLTCSALISSNYVYYALKSATQRFKDQASGTTFLEISGTIFKNGLVPLPPLAEQERIVAKLEELFAQVDEYGLAYKKLEKLNGGIDQKIKDAILLQIASGQIISGTQKIEEDKPFDIPEDWTWKTLGEISSLSLGKTPDSKNAAYWNGDIDWVSISDMQNGIVVDTSRKITKQAVVDKMGLPTPSGTLIMSFKLSIGKVAILSKDMYHNEAIAAIKVNESVVTNQWLYTVLPLMVTFGASSNAVKGSTLNKKSMQALQIPIPALDVQIELVHLYNEIMNKI